MSQSRVSPLLWGEMINDLGDRQWYITNHGQNKLKRPVLRAANAHHPNWQKLKSGLFRECSKPDGFFSKELIQVRAKHCWKKTNHFDDGSAAGGEEEHSRPCSTKRLNDFMLVFPPQSVQFKMWNILKKFCVCWNLWELCFIKESYKCDWGARDHPVQLKLYRSHCKDRGDQIEIHSELQYLQLSIFFACIVLICFDTCCSFTMVP